jgi:hypothetical protein
MIGTDNQVARAPAAAPARRFSPRAIRVRNRCLANLAQARSMPVPSARDLAAIGDDIGLRDAWASWSARQSGGARIVVSETPNVPTAAWWRTRRVVWGSLTATVLASAWVVRAHAWPIGASDARPPSEQWTMVGDTSIAHVNTVLLRLGQTSATLSVPLSPADVASLVLRRALWRNPALLTDVEARIDSLLWIRGILLGNPDAPRRFELVGRVRVPRAGMGQMDIVALSADDSIDLRPSPARVIDTNPNRRSDLPPIRFALPNFVRDIQLAEGSAMLLTRRR